MKRSLGEKRLAPGAAALLLALTACGWSTGEENAKAAAPGAEGGEAVPIVAQPEEAPPIIAEEAGRMPALGTVVAVVNGEAITLDELQRHSNPLLARWREKVGREIPPTIKEGILRAQLENLIDRKLILMDVRELGARIEDWRVREFIMSLSELKMSYDGDLGKYLAAKGLTYNQLYEEIEEHLLFGAVVREKVLPKVRVAPSEVRQAYERNIDRFTEEAAIHCYAITFLKRSNPDDAAASTNRAREALRKLNEGAYFPDVAKEYSEDPIYAEKGGDWGWISPGTLEKKASDAAFALEEGQRSGIVEGDAAYWILWIKEKRERSVIPLSAAWKEIELDIKIRKQDVELRRWGQRLRLKAAITYPVPLSEIVRRK